jgi:hypothetical protein
MDVPAFLLKRDVFTEWDTCLVTLLFTLYDDLKNYLQPYPENDYIRGLVYQYVQQRPEKKTSVSIKYGKKDHLLAQPLLTERNAFSSLWPLWICPTIDSTAAADFLEYERFQIDRSLTSFY